MAKVPSCFREIAEMQGVEVTVQRGGRFSLIHIIIPCALRAVLAERIGCRPKDVEYEVARRGAAGEPIWSGEIRERMERKETKCP